MDELEIEGKRYLSSKRAAKLHKYHIDYIGQLIRAGKISGKKVGRSWYVEETSLNAYLTQEAVGSTLVSTLVAAPTEIAAQEPTPIIAAPEPVFAEEMFLAPMPAVANEPQEDQESEPAAVQAAPVAFASSLHAQQTTPMSRQTLHEAVRAHSEEAEEREVRFTTPEPVPPRKPATLTYIEDSEPLLPVLDGRSRANADFVAIPIHRGNARVEEEDVEAADEEETDDEEEAPVAYRAQHQKRRYSFPLVQTLVAVVVLVAAAAAIASAMLGTSISVSDGQPASVVYTIK